jgi:drug/metabolite transporter (DMT)-like permease
VNAVPQSWGWYGEAIKWFVAIAAALLAFGFDRARDGSMAGLYWWMYLVGAFGLSVCVVAGLFAYLQLLGASNVLELPNKTPEDDARFERFRRRLSRSYQVCVGALAAGIVLSVIPWVGSVWPTTGNTLSPVVIAKAGGGDDLVITRQLSDVTEVLVSTPNGSLAWAHATPLHPKEQPSGSCGSCDHRD